MKSGIQSGRGTDPSFPGVPLLEAIKKVNPKTVTCDAFQLDTIYMYGATYGNLFQNAK